MKKLNEWIIIRVPRWENGNANALAGIAATLPINKIVMLYIRQNGRTKPIRDFKTGKPSQ